MKKVSIILMLFVFISSYSQKYFDENNFDNYIDYTDKKLHISFDDYDIEGSFIEIMGKDFYKYLIVKGNKEIHCVLKIIGKGSFYGLDILKGDYEQMLKEFNKGRKYNKVQIIFSNLPSDNTMNNFNFIPESIMKMRLERIKREKETKIKDEQNNLKSKQFDQEILNSDLIGSYKIKILKNRNIDYSSSVTLGKIIITEVGITIETEIPSIDLIRGSYDKLNSDISKRNLTCNINKGFGDYFSLVLNENKSVGGLTIMNGRNSSTTTFMIIE
jgi:hypothetical protein